MEYKGEEYPELITINSGTYGKYVVRATAIVDMNVIYDNRNKKESIHLMGNKLQKLLSIDGRIRGFYPSTIKALHYHNSKGEKISQPMVLVYYFPFFEDNLDWDNSKYFEKTGRNPKKLPIGIVKEDLMSKLEKLKNDYIFEILI
jgi:hypothetical protein